MPKPDYETTIGESKLPVADRPAEVTAALALLPTAYGAFTAIHLPQLAAAILACVVALVPWAISWWRDGQRDLNDPGDCDPENGPVVAKGKHEKTGREHQPAV